MANIMEIIIRIIWAIVGGAISITFIFGSLGALGYMVYYFLKYGKDAFVNEFLVK